MEKGEAADAKRNSDKGKESLAEVGKVKEEDVLKFLDSMDGYINLMDSLSSTLRQGWLELASARHSMGASRINSALFDLQHHSASTTLLIDDLQANFTTTEPHFFICKWGSPCKCCSTEAKFAEDELSPGKHGNSKLHPEGTSPHSENQQDGQESNGSPHAVDNLVKKERLKSLSIFGTLVSPKLGAAQLSFETALDILVEIANARSSMLSAYDRVHEGSQGPKG